MGGRASRPKESSLSVSGLLHLPFDVYLGILGQLSTSSAKDRQTLLALALCCRALRDSSQRILFSALSCDQGGKTTTSTEDLERLLNVHAKFLRAVVDSPDRLALYVVKYSQHALALEPALRTRREAHTLAHRDERVRLWRLTRKALPLMVNLRHLCFGVAINDECAHLILADCTFQLESFTWSGTGCEKSLYTTFLLTQRSLLHLDINSAGHNDRPMLPAIIHSVFLEMKKATTEMALGISYGTADTGRSGDIEAAEREAYLEARMREAYPDALGRIKYLHLWKLSQFHEFTSGITLHSVTVLELRVWRVEDIKHLSQFPALLLLRLLESVDCLLRKARETAILRDAATLVFAQPSKIRSVLIGLASAANSGCVWRYSLRHDGSIDERLVSTENHIDPEW